VPIKTRWREKFYGDLLRREKGIKECEGNDEERHAVEPRVDGEEGLIGLRNEFVNSPSARFLQIPNRMEECIPA